MDDERIVAMAFYGDVIEKTKNVYNILTIHYAYATI